MKSKIKLGNKGGFTLVEMLVCVVILVLLVIAMGTGISTAVRVYHESIFQSNSATLTSMLNATIDDVLRYSEDIYVLQDGTTDFANGEKVIEVSSVPSGVTFLFTNKEYSGQHAYIFANSGDTGSPVQMMNILGGSPRDLLNTGAYPNLTVKDLIILYDSGAGVFRVSYKIASTENAEYTLDVESVVRILNR